VSADQLVVVDHARAAQRYIPASTFKFANSLIALEVGAISGAHEIIPYGGKPQPFRNWERDMAIGEAFAVSSVPVFQELARRIGAARYADWLGRLSYGNADIGAVVDRFWLDGPLKTSAFEQARFMAALAGRQLPFSLQTQSIVHDISIIERRKYSVLHGKTGWTTAPEPDIGWFVGWVERQGRIFAFALNMDIDNRSQVKLRISLTRELLSALEVF